MGSLRGTVRARVEVQGASKAQGDVKGVERSFRDLGAVGLQVPKSFEGLTGRLESLGRVAGLNQTQLDGLRQSFSGVAVAGGAVTAGIAAGVAIWAAWGTAVRRAAEAYYELALRGGDVSAVATAFERVASPELLGRLNQATGGLVANLDLMRNATRALRTELVSEEEYTRWAEIVTRSAQDAGRNVGASLDSMANALSGGGLEVFSQLGVNIARVRDQVRVMGESMETERGRVIALRLAMEQAGRTMGEFSNNASNLNDAFTAASVSIRNWLDQFARIVSESPAAVGALETFRRKLEESGTGATAMGSAVAEAMARVIGATALMVANTVRSLQYLNQGYLAVVRTIAEFGEPGTAWRAQFRGAISGLELQVDTLRGLADAAQAAADIARSLPAVAPPTARPADQQGGREGGPPRAARAPQAAEAREEPEYIRELIELGERYQAQQVAFREKQVAEDAAEVERIRATDAVRAEVLEKELAREREAHDERMAHEEALQRKIEERNTRVRQDISNTAKFADTLGSIFDRVASNLEAQGKNADGWRKAQGVALGIKYTIEAVAAGADAVRAFASQNYTGGALAIAAAAEYAVAAGMAYSQLAQSGGGGSPRPKASAGSYTPAPAGPTVTEQVNSGGTYNYYSLSATEPELARTLRRADWQLDRSGSSSPGNAAVGYA